MSKFIDYAVIQQVVDGQEFDGPIAPCFVSILGDSPNARVRASVWDPSTRSETITGYRTNGAPIIHVERREPGFADWDTLSEATVNFSERTGLYTIEGVSERLQREGDLAVANARTEWRVKATGCQGC